MVLIQCCFINYPNTASRCAEGQKSGKGDTCFSLATWLLLSSLEKTVGLVPQDKEHFTKVILCLGTDLYTNAEYLHWPTKKWTLKSLNPDLTYPTKSGFVAFVKHPQWSNLCSATSNLGQIPIPCINVNLLNFLMASKDSLSYYVFITKARVFFHSKIQDVCKHVNKRMFPEALFWHLKKFRNNIKPYHQQLVKSMIATLSKGKLNSLKRKK